VCIQCDLCAIIFIVVYVGAIAIAPSFTMQAKQNKKPNVKNAMP
jgi:NADH:ubiquinone oxidoreductase subunit 6 (subunit J)